MPSETLRLILQLPFAFVRASLRYVLAIVYRGKGETVPPIKNTLLLKSASKLARDIREGTCKSEIIIQAYIERILEVEPYINATMERCFEEALVKAREVDSIITSGKFTHFQLSLEKSLLGVPISVKGTFQIKDMTCSGGCLLYSDLKATEDAPALAALKRAGAILITTTNVPELGLDIETYNKIYGRTSNPYDTNRTCGGSSGGEGALISAGASVLGLANDLLGSLRIPSHFNGIFCHKPSRGLVSNHGTSPFERPDISPESCCTEAFEFLTVGPMCRYAEDLVTSMKVLATDEEVKRKFDYYVDFNKVKIYYMTEIRSPLVAPVDNDIATALHNAVTYFEKKFHTTSEEVKMPHLIDVNRCIFSMMEPIFRHVKDSTMGHKGLKDKTEFVKSLLGYSQLCLDTTTKFSLLSNPLLFRKGHTLYYQNMTEKLKEEFSNLLEDNAVLLLPTFPVAAPYHLETFPLLPSLCYASLFNILGLPVSHCPLDFTRRGLPCGIQIVGKHNNDYLTIACAMELERGFGGWTS